MPFKYGPFLMQHYSRRWSYFKGGNEALGTSAWAKCRRRARGFPIIFLVIYIFIMVFALTVFFWDGDGMVMQQEEVPYWYVPKMPPRNHSNGCHANPEEILLPQNHTIGDTVVLNGYFDARDNQRVIRLLAIQRNASVPVYCLISHPQSKKLVAVKAEMREIGKTSLHVSGMLQCNVTDHLEHTPCKVRLSSVKTLNENHITVPLTLIQASNAQVDGVVVCVPPLNSIVHQPQLVEFIELTKLLGANMLIFYKQKSNPNADEIFEFYKNDPAVTVYDWPSRSHSQLSQQHCLYSAIPKYKYAVFTQINRFLIPRERPSWPALMQYLDFNNTSPYSAFCFPVALFPLDVTHALSTPFSVHRLRESIPKKTVCLVKPSAVVEMRKVPEFVDARHAAMDAFDGSALVHWYRACKDCHRTEEDTSALHYKQALIENYKEVMYLIAHGNTMHS
jgi:hypothetical protein